jgi:hypothetical protein
MPTLCFVFTSETDTQEIEQYPGSVPDMGRGLVRASYALALISLAGMAPFVYVEFATVMEYGFGGWVNVWNILDVIAYGNQVGFILVNKRMARRMGGKTEKGEFCILKKHGTQGYETPSFAYLHLVLQFLLLFSGKI